MFATSAQDSEKREKKFWKEEAGKVGHCLQRSPTLRVPNLCDTFKTFGGASVLSPPPPPPPSFPLEVFMCAGLNLDVRLPDVNHQKGMAGLLSPPLEDGRYADDRVAVLVLVLFLVVSLILEEPPVDDQRDEDGPEGKAGDHQLGHRSHGTEILKSHQYLNKYKHSQVLQHRNLLFLELSHLATF